LIATVFASSFTQPAGRAQYRPSFAVRLRPGQGLSRAAVGPHNRGMHADMLAAYGVAIDHARFESVVGSTYVDFYRLLLERAVERGLRLPPLVVTGHAVPDLRLDETPSVRLIGEFDGPVATFAVVEETPLAAFLSVQAATIAARSQGFGSFAVVLADRADLVYDPTGPESERVEEFGIFVGFDQSDRSPDGPLHRVHWRSHLRSPEALAAAAKELTASATGTIVISTALAARWDCPGDQVLVAPANQPATGLLHIALDQPAGSEPLLVAFDPVRGQLVAMSFRVPEVNL
jgi:hypothetical protein